MALHNPTIFSNDALPEPAEDMEDVDHMDD